MAASSQLAAEASLKSPKVPPKSSMPASRSAMSKELHKLTL